MSLRPILLITLLLVMSLLQGCSAQSQLLEDEQQTIT
ncbi:MAG: hypothetical protein ACI9Q4_002147, partial [Sediminicola sp.]